MSGWQFIPLAVALAAGPPAPVTSKPRVATVAPRATASITLSVTPATISFQATDPDSPADPGSSAAVVKWTSNSTVLRQWSLSVQPSATSFQGCPTVPVSAVTVTCTQATNATLFGNGACSAPAALTTSPQTVASGNEGLGSGAYEVDLTFTLTDSWKYIANSSPQCTLTVTYTSNLP